jgi:hypothetical protein
MFLCVSGHEELHEFNLPEISFICLQKPGNSSAYGESEGEIRPYGI